MDKIKNTFNAFFPPYKKGMVLDERVMYALVKAQGLPELDEAMHDMMALYGPALSAEMIDVSMWQSLIDGSQRINQKYGNKVEIARINLGILSYLDEREEERKHGVQF